MADQITGFDGLGWIKEHYGAQRFGFGLGGQKEEET